jgi:aminoglycoside phosphotransferase (APT) family kinase protein
MTGDVHALERGGSEAADGLREPLAASLGVAADSLRVTLAYRGQLADSTSIFLAGNARGQVLGAVLWSPEAVPDAVALSMAKAQAASALLPPELASRVLAPRAQGRVAGRSFALMPYCRPLSRRRPLWWLQRSTVREVVLEWLHGVCRATARPVPPAEVATAFQQPLARLAAAEAATSGVRELARAALARLAEARWTPRRVLMHGDLWQGNLMVRAPGGPADLDWSRRVCLIDWGGSEPEGYAMFDLVRAADALRVAPPRLQREVAAHCRALSCEPVDAASHLAAGLAHVHSHLGEFPLERFVAMAEACRQTLQRAALTS